MNYPLVLPLAALALGIWAARHAAFSLQEVLLACLALGGLSLVGVRANSRLAGSAAALCGLAFAGTLLTPPPPASDPLLISSLVRNSGAPLTDPMRLRGYVKTPPESLGDADRFVLAVESAYHDVPTRGGVRITVARPQDGRPLQLRYGQRVELLARLRHLRNYENEGGFDRVGYLNSQGIHMTGTVRPEAPIYRLFPEGGNGWESWLWDIRLAARTRLDNFLSRVEASGEVRGILHAVLLGDSHWLPSRTRTQFERTGAYHALVISGLHIGVLAFTLLGLLHLLSLPPLAARIATVCLVGAYALALGGSLPVSRASWMLAAYLGASLVYRQRRALNVIAAVALTFVIVQPDLLSDVGFQLSFLAVGLIAAVGVPLLEGTLEPYRKALIDLLDQGRDPHLPPREAEFRVSLRSLIEPLAAVVRLPPTVVTLAVCGPLRLIIWAAELMAISIVIQIGLALPLAIHFQRVSWGAMTANLLLMPLLMIVVPAGLLALVANWPALGYLSMWAAQRMADVVAWHAEYLPVDVRLPPPPMWLGLLYALSLAALAVALHQRRWVKSTAAALAVLLAVLLWHPFPVRYQPGLLEMVTLDVGQGESLLLIFPNGQTMVVDGGGVPTFGTVRTRTFDVGDAVVSPYLWSRSIQELDVVAVTHADYDHIGGVPSLLRNFRVRELWLAAGQGEAVYEPLAGGAVQDGTRVIRLEAGETRSFGGARVEVLSPVRRSGVLVSRNDRSLVMRVRYGQQSLLLAADIQSAAEDQLVAQNQLISESVLKVAHHGSRTSSGRDFLEHVDPVFAVISAGRDNLYRHPHSQVLRRLNAAGATILRTDLDGRLSLSTDGRRWRISTYRRDRLGRTPSRVR